ncbi:MAG: AZOBR_p60025 family cell surface glycopolymer formation protein [Acidobacteriota bacterium]
MHRYRTAGTTAPGRSSIPGVGHLLVAGAAALAWAVVLSALAVSRFGGDPRAFLSLGTEVRHPEALRGAPAAGPAGYDGQYYAALATDPLLLQPGTRRLLDNPPYRATRVGVPLLAWLLAAGHPGAAVALYQALCWSLTLLGIGVAARWLEERGHGPWWALSLAAAGGVAASMLRTTPDGAAAALIVVSLWLAGRERPVGALAVLCAACLVRETSVLAGPALAWAELRGGRRGWAAVVLAAPVGTLLAWQGYLHHALGAAFDRGTGNLGVPLAWVPAKLAAMAAGLPDFPWAETAGVTATLVTLAAAAAIPARERPMSASGAALLLFGALAMVAAINVYIEIWAYARALVMLPFLALMARPGVTGRARRLVTVAALAWAVPGCILVAGELAIAFEGRSAWRVLREGAPRIERITQPAAGPGGRAAPGWERRARAVFDRDETFLIVPAASTSGRGGVSWRTQFTVENLSPYANSLALELIPAGRQAFPARPLRVKLAPHEVRRWSDVVADGFGASGLAAVRVAARDGPVAAAARTLPSSHTGDFGWEHRPVGVRNALRAGEAGCFAGVPGGGLDPALGRANLGLLNVSSAPATVRLTVADESGTVIGDSRIELAASELVQLDGIGRRQGPAGALTAEVEVDRGTGPVVAYVAVLRGSESPEGAYLRPSPRRTDACR